MRKKTLIPVLFAVWITSCGSTPAATSPVSDVEERAVSDNSALNSKEWKLIEVRINNRNTGFKRDTLIREGFDQFFTLTLDTDTVSGTGAPNRYSAPYTLGDNQSINIKIMRSTLMASFFEPENLTEHDFFNYVQNAYGWKLAAGNLELQSKTAGNAEVILIFQ